MAVVTSQSVAVTSGGSVVTNSAAVPNYSSGGSLAANGAYNVGTWDDSPTLYEWVVVEADGTLVDSGTGATGTATFGATTGLLTLLVRASNDGGYDVGDFATRTASYGSSGDGYYEVATVTIDPTTTGESTITLPAITSAATGRSRHLASLAMTLPAMTSAATAGIAISGVRLKTITRPIAVKSITRPINVYEVPV